MVLMAVCGIELRQRSDHTGVVVLVVEKRAQPGEFERVGCTHLPHETLDIVVAHGQYMSRSVSTEKHYTATHLRRLPPGTRYLDVVDAIKDVDRQVTEKTKGKIPVMYVINVTGRGTPVIDLLRKEVEEAHIEAAFLIDGTEMRIEKRDKTWYIPEVELLSTLQVLFETRRVHLTETRYADVLKDQLLSFEMKTGDARHNTYGVFNTGKDDDLVTALGLGVYYSENRVVPCIFRLD